MKFDKKEYDENGKETWSEATFPSINSARLFMTRLFMTSEDAARCEELKMADGRWAFSLKDRSNKIIIQLKAREVEDPIKEMDQQLNKNT